MFGLVAINPQVSGSLPNVAPERGRIDWWKLALAQSVSMDEWLLSGIVTDRSSIRRRVRAFIPTRKVPGDSGRLSAYAGCSGFISGPAPLMSWQGYTASLSPEESVRRRAASGICNF